MKYFAWYGDGDWSPDGSEVEAHSEGAAAAIFAGRRDKILPQDVDTSVVSVVPEDRPHRLPPRWGIHLETRSEWVARPVRLSGR